MEYIAIIAIVTTGGALGGGVFFAWMRREVKRRHNEFRMSQALRRGLANPDGVQAARMPVLQWQSCESTAH